MTFRLEVTPAVLQRAEDIKSRLDAKKPIGFQCSEVQGRSHILREFERIVDDALIVRVPNASLDQIERVLLEIASGLGSEVIAKVDAQLQQHPGKLERPFDELAQSLESRTLVISGWEMIGSRGLDWEMGEVVSAQWKQLQSWLEKKAAVIAFSDGSEPQGTTIHPFERFNEPPMALHNGASYSTEETWRRYAPDSQRFTLALTLQALEARPTPHLDHLSTDVLRSQLVNLLPNDAATILYLLALHGRAMPEKILAEEIGYSKALSQGIDLGLWHLSTSGVICEDSWTVWCRNELPNSERKKLHARLADAFAKHTTTEAHDSGQEGLMFLEAHRHFVEAGDLTRALKFARYGAALLIEKARDVSMEQQHEEAAKHYQMVVNAIDSQQLPITARLSGYARHYLHYNRAHASLEGFEETEVGYKKSLSDWPDNALFWSRLIRTQIYQSKLSSALETLEKARKAVPEHPNKEYNLIDRTVRGLLTRNRVLEAVQVWGDYRPTLIKAKETEEKLEAQLSAGWLVDELAFVNGPALYFTKEVRVLVTRADVDWVARAPEFEYQARSSSPESALRQLTAKFQEDARRLLKAYSARLSPMDRERKQKLLGTADIVRSKLDASSPAHTWVYGEIVPDKDGKLWFRAGEQGPWFELSEELSGSMAADGVHRLAKVKTDHSGVANGPVVEIESPFEGDEEELWKAWHQRLERGS